MTTITFSSPSQLCSRLFSCCKSPQPQAATVVKPLSPEEIHLKVSSLFANVSSEEWDNLTATTQSYSRVELANFLISLETGPETLVRFSKSKNCWQFPKKNVFLGLRAFMEGKISESMFVTIALLWSHVNHFGQQPKIIEGRQLQELIKQHGLEVPMSDESVPPAEKKIYAFNIEQPEKDPDWNDDLFYDDKKTSNFPGIFKRLFNILDPSMFGMQVPLHFISQNPSAEWELLMPAFYLTKHDRMLKNIKLHPEIGLASSEKVYEYFMNNEHPFALFFPGCKKMKMRTIHTQDTGRLAPGAPMHDTVHAYLKSEGFRLGSYQFVQDYLQFGLPLLEQEAKKIPYYLNPNTHVKKHIDDYLTKFKELLIDFEFSLSIKNALFSIPDSDFSEQKAIAKKTLFEEVIVRSLIAWDIITNAEQRGDKLPVRQKIEVDLGVFITNPIEPSTTYEQVQILTFNTFAQHLFPLKLPRRLAFEDVLREYDLPPEHVERLQRIANSLANDYNHRLSLPSDDEGTSSSIFCFPKRK